MYRPNFCAECGERVAGARRHWWESSRFCQACARLLRRGRLLRAMLLAVFLAGGGFLAGRGLRPTSAPPLAQSGPLNLAPLPAEGSKRLSTEQPSRAGGGGAQAAPRYGPDGSAEERPTDPNEVVTICGARTKKGTPCQRRVRGEGRCWQHLGKAAVIPLQKRTLTGN
jgi:hypothetical protein